MLRLLNNAFDKYIQKKKKKIMRIKNSPNISKNYQLFKHTKNLPKTYTITLPPYAF